MTGPSEPPNAPPREPAEPASVEGPPDAEPASAPPPSGSTPQGPPAVAGTIPGWRPEGAGSSGGARRLGCIIVALVVGILGLAMISMIGLIFLGGQVQSILAGTVTFGPSGSGCSVSEVSETLPATGPIYVAAYLEREAQPGEVVRLVVATQGERVPIREEPITEPTQCFHLEIPAGDAAPGTYTFEFLIGEELLATGTVQLTP